MDYFYIPPFCESGSLLRDMSHSRNISRESRWIQCCNTRPLSGMPSPAGHLHSPPPVTDTRSPRHVLHLGSRPTNGRSLQLRRVPGRAGRAGSLAEFQRAPCL